ncbi:hypothetical protein ACS0TY_001829 [Phlomoides rotata]
MDMGVLYSSEMLGSSWRVIHGKIPTWDYLQCRGFAGPSRCVLCGNHSEDMDHLWCHCPWAHILFDKVKAIFSAHLSFEFGFHHWLLQAMARNFSTQVLSIWRLAVVTMVWLVWDQRNRCIFIGRRLVARTLLHSFGLSCAKPMVATLVVCRTKSLISRSYRLSASLAGHRKLLLPYAFLGSPRRFGSSRSAYRWRGFSGQLWGVFRGCSAMQHGSGFAFEAKLATTFSAVEIAFDKQWLHLWLERVSVYVVNVFKRHTSLVPWRLLGQWHRVRRLMGDMQIVVSHIYREGNASADRLTREPVDGFEW